MSNVELDELPNEMLEEVFSYMSNGKDLYSCRLVSRRWNSSATKFWKQLPSTRAHISTTQSMSAFLATMKSRNQEFPFCRVRFNLINSRNIKAAHAFFINVSSFIEDLHISQISVNSELFSSLIEHLDISILSNLVKLRIDSAIRVFTPPTLNLAKLNRLQMSVSTVEMERLSMFLVKASPNLKLFKTLILNSPQSFNDNLPPVWQFCEEYKRITIIEAKLTLNLRMTSVSRLINLMVKKLNEWKNIQVTELNMTVSVHDENDILLAKEGIESLIQAQAESIRYFEMKVSFHQVKLPVMSNLDTLNLTFIPNLIGNAVWIEGNNPFPSLQNVILDSYNHPCRVFRFAVLESVKTFTLINPSDAFDVDLCVSWDTVFPNLESFTYKITSNRIENPHFNFVFAGLRMKSLTYVRVEAPTNMNPSLSPGFRNFLSGFTDFEEVIEGALEAKSNGGINGEDEYWYKMEASQRPCLSNMPALTSLYLDAAMDDDITSYIIARMKPLDHLTIYSENLSEEVIQKLYDRHRQVELLYSKLNE